MCFPIILENTKELGFRNFKRGVLFGLPFFLLGVYMKPDAELVLGQLTTALIEEIFFRGFLLPYLGNILTSLAFMLAHLISSFTLKSVLVFFPSLILGYLYIKTGSIVVPVLIHACMNLFYLRLIEEFPELYSLLQTELARSYRFT